MSAEWFDELAGFLRIPSISADAAHAGDVKAAGAWVCERIVAAGGSAELVDWHGAPLAVGEIRGRGAQKRPTVICYGHFDVQPPDPLELWESDPFEPEVRDGYLYGRGTVDDKGQLYMLLAGARALAATGELAVDVRFICDGEEEVGGHSIVEYLAADDRGGDGAIIFDSDMIRRGLPAFNVATRGLLYYHLVLRSGAGDLHSGLYGGAALNAANALASTIARVVASDGRLAAPLRAGIAPPTAEELACWAQLPAGADELESQGARPADPRAAEEFHRRTFAEPSLDVNGFDSGSPYLQKTVLPVRADANVSLRLAPGQDPEEIAAAFEKLVREAAPAGIELEIERLSSAEPGLVNVSSPVIRHSLDAFERVIGVRPVLIRSGGTLPVIAALSHKGIASVLTGFGLPDSNIHAPNERLVADYVELGTAAARQLFRELAQLQPTSASS